MDEIIQIQEKEITGLIVLLRGEKVILDFNLARLYGVEVKSLKRTVRRHLDRFPDDFMFQLTREEYQSLRYQTGTLEKGQHAKYLPFAFTEQGVAMLSGILNSPSAIQVNIAIMRAFVSLRRFIESNKELRQRLEDLEKEVFGLDEKIDLVFSAIRQLMEEKDNPEPRNPVGFKINEQ